MNTIRKAVIPAAGPRIALAFALPIISFDVAQDKLRVAHAAALTGRAVFKVFNKGGNQ